jgi:putative flippase GtrA
MQIKQISGLPWRELIRYAVVGFLSNLAGYLIYLLITWMGVEPKTTVTIFYPIAAAIGYFGHAQYSFSYRGRHGSGFSRYVLAHLFGYLLNIISLYFFVDVLLYPHQMVQFFNIFLVSGFLFLVFKYYTFHTNKVEYEK